MDFKVEIENTAIADLKEIVSYVAQNDPAAAELLANALLDTALSLAQAPCKGSQYRRLAGIRKLTLRPYKIYYRIDESRKLVQVLRFWHFARREPYLKCRR